jgi:hypothetical protein
MVWKSIQTVSFVLTRCLTGRIHKTERDATATWATLVPRRLNVPQLEALVCLHLRGRSI